MGEVPEVPSDREIAALLARREYATAAEVLSAVCRQQPRNLGLRQQLAEVLLAGGDSHKALRVLEALVDDYARAGFFAKAIAQAKKVQQIEPGRRSIEFKLAVLLNNESTAAGGGVGPPGRAQADAAVEARPAPAPPSPQAPRTTARPMEKLLPPVEALLASAKALIPYGGSGAAVPLQSTPGAVETAQPSAALEASTAPEPEPRQAVPTSRDELAVAARSLDDDVFVLPDIHDASAAFRETGSGLRTIQGSALFNGLDAEQLHEVIGGLRLTSVQPGEIIVAEGEPGGSLFLIASGKVRVYARSHSGRQKQVRTMRQGDFFGEISLLTGSRRTATITAATPCEVLELDRETVDAIAQRKPEVREIISAFCRRRSGSTEEKTARAD